MDLGVEQTQTTVQLPARLTLCGLGGHGGSDPYVALSLGFTNAKKAKNNNTGWGEVAAPP
jgi:hypothetical protein